MKQLRFTAW